MSSPLYYVKLCTPDPTSPSGCDHPPHASNPDHKPGKQPTGGAGWQRAGSPERPEGNAGVLCGPDFDLLVVEVDGPVEAETVKTWGLPETYTVRSGREDGGWHLYFTWPRGLTHVPHRLDGVQLKYNGQVVSAGSLHQSGRRYEVTRDCPRAELPDAFIRRLLDAAGPTSSASTGEGVDYGRVLAGLPEGERDDGLFRYVSGLWARGFRREEMLLMARQAATNAVPPFDLAKVDRMVEDVCRKFQPGATPSEEAIEETLAFYGKEDEPARPKVDPTTYVIGSPIPLEDPRWPIMRPEGFHGICRDIVDCLAPSVESDDVAILVEFLAAFGNLCGTGPHLRVGGARHPARLYSVLVGNSATGRKSGGWNAIQPLMEFVDPEWYSYNISGAAPASGEGLIALVQDEHQVKDRGKTHTEPAGYKRRLIHDSEFAGRTLVQMKRAGSTLSAILRDAWDREVLYNATVTHRRATGAHISFVGHTTSRELLSQLTANDITNGFANRFLFFMVRRNKLLPQGGEYDHARLAELGQMVQHRVTQAHLQTRMRYSDAGGAYWDQIYVGRETGAMHEENDEMAGLTARVGIHAQRLQLIFALLDRSEFIEPVHVDASLAMADYAVESAVYMLNQEGAHYASISRDAQRVHSLVAGVDEITGRAISRKLGMNSTRLNLALAELARYQMVTVRRAGKSTLVSLRHV